MSRGAKFWINGFLPVLFVALAAGLAWTWNVNGGWPADHDSRGVAEVPGITKLDLPAGESRLYWQAAATGGGENRSVAERPDDLELRLSSPAGGPRPEVEEVPSWTFASIAGDTGYEPYAKVEVDEGGRFIVGVPPPSEPVPPQASVSFGPEPWNPGGSLALGTALVVVAVLGFGAANWAIFHFAFRNGGDRASAG